MSTSIAALDVESRALMDLSLVQDLPDAELGRLLAIEPAELRRRRNDVFEKLGASTPLARAAVVRTLRGQRREEASGTSPAGTNGHTSEVPSPATRPPSQQDRSPDPLDQGEPDLQDEVALWDSDVEWVDGVTSTVPPGPVPSSNGHHAIDSGGPEGDLASRDVPSHRDDPVPLEDPLPPLDDGPAALPYESLDGPTVPPPPVPWHKRYLRKLRHPSRPVLIAVGVAVLVTGLLLILGGDEDERARAPGGVESKSPSSPRPNGIGALASPTGGVGAGESEILGSGEDRRLKLKIGGLPRPDGLYVVWIYNSVSDTFPLATARKGDFEQEIALPASAKGYTYLDVSEEPDDGNVAHSGASVLRSKLDRIPAR